MGKKPTGKPPGDEKPGEPEHTRDPEPIEHTEKPGEPTEKNEKTASSSKKIKTH